MKQPRNTTWSVLGSSVLVFALALGGACSKSAEKAAQGPEQTTLAEASQGGEGAQAGMPAIEGRKIVYTGLLSLTVKSYDDARYEVDRLLKNSGGFVARGETQGSGDHRYGTLTLRVPTSNFAALSSQLKKLGEVDRETIAADDVTEQHVDLERPAGQRQEARGQVARAGCGKD